MKKVTVELTPEQAYTLMDALEFFSRVSMGQFEHIEYRMELDTYDEELKRPKYDRELATAYLRLARRIIFTDLSDSAYKSILGTSERSKISWDIYQQLRHDISHYKFPDEPISCQGRSFNRPFVTSKEPLPKVTITDE